jgi:hypothetical protein
MRKTAHSNETPGNGKTRREVKRLKTSRKSREQGGSGISLRPVRVDEDPAYVNAADGLIPIPLKKEAAEARPCNSQKALPLWAAVNHFFGHEACSLKTEKEEMTLLQSIDRYLEHCQGTGGGH